MLNLNIVFRFKRWLIDFVGEDLATLDEVLVSGGGNELFFDQLKEILSETSSAKIIRSGGRRTGQAIRKVFFLKSFRPID